jgi:hypothetical protein
MNMSLLLLEFACGALLCCLLVIPSLAARFSRRLGSNQAATAAVRQPGGGR